jgi:hypothetical protein
MGKTVTKVVFTFKKTKTETFFLTSKALNINSY